MYSSMKASKRTTNSFVFSLNAKSIGYASDSPRACTSPLHSSLVYGSRSHRRSREPFSRDYIQRPLAKSLSCVSDYQELPIVEPAVRAVPNPGTGALFAIQGKCGAYTRGCTMKHSLTFPDSVQTNFDHRNRAR